MELTFVVGRGVYSGAGFIVAGGGVWRDVASTEKFAEVLASYSIQLE